MCNLSVDDFKYFDEKFGDIHTRIGLIDSDISKIKVEAESRLTKLETKHIVTNSKKKETMSYLSIIGAYVMIAAMFIV